MANLEKAYKNTLFCYLDCVNYCGHYIALSKILKIILILAGNYAVRFIMKYYYN